MRLSRSPPRRTWTSFELRQKFALSSSVSSLKRSGGRVFGKRGGGSITTLTEPSLPRAPLAHPNTVPRLAFPPLLSLHPSIYPAGTLTDATAPRRLGGDAPHPGPPLRSCLGRQRLRRRQVRGHGRHGGGLHGLPRRNIRRGQGRDLHQVRRWQICSRGGRQGRGRLRRLRRWQIGRRGRRLRELRGGHLFQS